MLTRYTQSPAEMIQAGKPNRETDQAAQKTNHLFQQLHIIICLKMTISSQIIHVDLMPMSPRAEENVCFDYMNIYIYLPW